MFLPEAKKAEARQRSRPPRDWGEEGHTTGPGGPLLPPGQDPVSLRPLKSGALTAPPHRQPEMVNCPHCTEGTSEASGERSLRGSRRQRRLSQHPCFSLCPLQSGVGVPLPPPKSAPFSPALAGRRGWHLEGEERQDSGKSEGGRPAVPSLHLPSGQAGVSVGLDGAGWTLTVPSCPSGPVAACDAAASSSSWGRAGGCRVTVRVEGGSPRPSLPLPQPALSPRMGGRRSPLPGPARSRSLPPPRWRLRPRPPGHSSRQVWVLALPAFRPPPQGPWKVPASVGRPAARQSTGCVRGSSPPSPGGGKQVSPLLPLRLPQVPAPPTARPPRV